MQSECTCRHGRDGPCGGSARDCGPGRFGGSVPTARIQSADLPSLPTQPPFWYFSVLFPHCDPGRWCRLFRQKNRGVRAAKVSPRGEMSVRFHVDCPGRPRSSTAVVPALCFAGRVPGCPQRGLRGLPCAERCCALWQETGPLERARRDKLESCIVYPDKPCLLLSGG